MEKSVELVDKILEKSIILSKKSSVNINNSIKFYSALYGVDYNYVINESSVRKVS
jgi:hypothetical protein